MKAKILQIGFLSAVLVCVTAAFSHATIVGQVWLNVPTSVSEDALIANTPVTAPDATFNPTAINYDSSVGGYTVGGFLNNPLFSNTSAGFSAGANLDNTFMLFTGQTFLKAGDNSFVTAHDDGFELRIPGASFDLQEPGPTAPVFTPYTVTAPADGMYDFTLAYGECCGPPATLTFQVNGAPVGNVPEPSSLLLLGSGLLGMGGIAWRKIRG
jgi:hypothetical protein